MSNQTESTTSPQEERPRYEAPVVMPLGAAARGQPGEECGPGSVASRSCQTGGGASETCVDGTVATISCTVGGDP